MLISRVSLVLLELLRNVDSEKIYNETHQISVLNDIINTANNERHIDTIAYFGQRDVIEPYLSTVMSGTPKVVITHASTQLSHFEHIFSNKIFFLAFGSLDVSSNWDVLYDAFTSMQSHVRGIFIAPNTRGLLDHFDWCWQNGFMNAITFIPLSKKSQSYKLYTYTPFPKLKVFEVPHNASNSLFHNKLNDLKGYKIRTAVRNDPPRVYSIPDPNKPNRTKFYGLAAKTYLEFLRYHNARLEIVEESKVRNYDILSVIDQLNKGLADLSMNIYLPYLGTRISYPLSMLRWCILVPANGEIKGYTLFLRPFHLAAWFLCFVMLIYLSFIKSFNEYIDSKFHYIKHRHMDFGHSFIEILRLMLYIPAPQTYQNFRWHYAWNYGVVAILGFMLSNLYLAVLTSFLSKIIYEKQIETLSEMVTQNISIHAFEHEVPIILQNRGLPKGFADLLVPRNTSEMMRDLILLRLGQAYAARADTLYFVLVQQHNVVHPRFHLAEECMTTVPVGFLLPSHSQYKNELDIFTLRAAAAGLVQYWFEETISDAFHLGYLKNENEQIELTSPLSLEHFHFAYLILFNGQLIAALAFIMEQLTRFRVHISLKRN